MRIICNEGRFPGKDLLKKMEEGAALCVQGEGLDPDKAEISLTFVSDLEIQELNNLYRGVDKVTDVLSFPQYEDLEAAGRQEEIPLGDVVICTEQAVLQADEFGHSNERELVYLFIHSMFHLLGYDHMEEEDRAAMRRREEEIMAAIHIER